MVHMRLATFHQLRAAVQANGSPGAPKHLTEVAGKLCDMLSNTGLFEWFEVGTTDDPDRLVIGMCHLKADSSDIVTAQRLEAIWSNGLLRPNWGAHVVILEDGHVELEGATMVSDRGNYVTVHVLATRTRVPEQRRPKGRHSQMSADVPAQAQAPAGSRSDAASLGGSTNR